jgi:hypothetical protein
MGWMVGDSFRARDTQDVKGAGITPGSGGEITSILGAKVSFHVERGGPGSGFVEAHCHLGTFSKNFAPDRSKETARRTTTNLRIFPKKFPNDFVR